MANYRNVLLKMIKEALNRNNETIRLILKEDLYIAKVCVQNNISMGIEYFKEIVGATNNTGQQQNYYINNCICLFRKFQN